MDSERPSSHPGRLWIAAAYVAVCILWGSTYLGIRIALESYPPFLLGAARFLFSGAALFAVARARGETAPTTTQWGAAALTGSLFFVVGNGFLNVAERWVATGLASVLVATMPLWATLFARLFGQVMSRREVAGALLGLVGVAVLNLGGELRASPLGAAFALLAPVGWALGSVVSQRLPSPAGGTMRTAAQMLGGGVALLIVGLCLRERVGEIQTVRSIAAVAYLTVFGSLIGFSAFSLLLHHTRPAVATSYAYINPVIAIVLGVLFAGERFDLSSFFGTAIVLAAVVMVATAGGAAAARPQR